MTNPVIPGIPGSDFGSFEELNAKNYPDYQYFDTQNPEHYQPGDHQGGQGTSSLS